MLLTSLKNGGKWDYMGGSFRIKVSVFQRLMKSFLVIVSPFLYDTQVTDRAGRITMRQLSSQGKQFRHRPYTLYATDVTFQQTSRPSGNHQESKFYFSAKDKLYGFKVKVSVLPNGLATGSSFHRQGSVSDLTMFRESFEWHKKASKNAPEDNEVSDHGPPGRHFLDMWAILTDKGYQGAQDNLRVLLPKNKRPHRMLSVDEEQEIRICIPVESLLTTILGGPRCCGKLSV